MPSNPPNRKEPGPDRFAVSWARYRPKSRHCKSPFAIIPLVDTAFILLIFMAASSAFVTQPGVIVELPAGRFASGSHYGNLIVTITQEGFVFFNDERAQIEDLAHAFSQAAHRNKNAYLLIEADYRVPYGDIARVMMMADYAGISRVNLAHSPAPGEKPVLAGEPP